MKIVITGGAGFVGSNLAIKLKAEFPDYTIKAFDNLYRRGSELSINRLTQARVDFIHGDVRIKEDLLRISPFDLLIECSAEPSVKAGIGQNASYVVQTNLIGTINCLDSCVSNRADIILISSSRIYPKDKLSSLVYNQDKDRFILAPNQGISGISATHGINETFPLEGGRSLYGATKLCSEILVREYIDLYGIKGVINRCGVLSGPWQMGTVDQGFVVLWLAKHLWGRELAYIGYGGRGLQVRDVLHINDLYELIKIQIRKISQLNREVFNVGGGTKASVSLRELTKMCECITGNSIHIKSIEETHENDIPYYISDSRKVQKRTEWRVNFRIEDTLKDIYDWMIENENDLKPILA